MSFDYFNVSHLAFGSKITKAFTQLNRLCTEAEGNLDYLYQLLDIYGTFINKNYPCPFPNTSDAPVRAKELFDLLNDANTLRKIYLDSNNKLNCEVVLYKRSSNRFTVATGQTSLKKGYVFCKDSVSNKNYERDLQFVEDYNTGIGNFLFEFRIDDDNNINIVGDTNRYFLPSNFDHVTTMEKAETILTNSRIDNVNDEYEAEDYEAVLIVGYAYPEDNENPKKNSAKSDLRVTVNGQSVVDVSGWLCRQFTVIYLKPGDILRASCKTAFRIKYKSGEPIPPQPEPPQPVTPLEIETNQVQRAMYQYSGGEWHYVGGWTNAPGSEETAFTGSISTEQIGVSNGFACGAIFNLNRDVTADDNYKLSLRYSGTVMNPYYSIIVMDACRVFFIDNEGNAISDQTFSVTAPGGDGGYTTATISDVSIPEGTRKIRIASMGFSYNSYQQRYYSHFRGASIVIQEPSEEEEE